MKYNPLFLLVINLWVLPALAEGVPAGAQAQAEPSEASQKALTDNQILITKEQFTNLAITTDKLAAIKDVPILYAPGQVIVPPDNDYIVSAAQAGLISKLNVAIGDRVEQGEVLAVINSPELLALQRQYLRTISERQLAHAVYQRDKKLLAEGVISNSRWEQTRNRYTIANSEANESKQLLQIAGMSDAVIKKLAREHRLGSQLDVYSPISGVVLDKMASVGTRISGQTPLYRVADIRQLWLEINIPQERIGDISVGDQVQIDGSPVVAEISLLGQGVNPQNQTILARAVIKAWQNRVRPGQSVNTKIVKTVKEPVFKVPNQAIAQREGRAYIFIRNEQGFRVSLVKVIGKQGAESIISGDLTGDEVIATQGSVALKANWMGLGSEE